MRLTLRTLLGYLDDILEPQQARQLGEKISESTVAAGIVARIREVVRRRRIGAPELTGPGSDPDSNVVAEYLDNTLAPEKVEDLERLCLESDLHLAEVAACHQILTLVLGEPVEVQPGLRERMYALGKVAEAEGGAERPRTAAAAAGAPPAAPVEPDGEARPQIPEYLTRGAAWRRLIPYAAAVLVLGVWIGLIISDPDQSWRFWSADGAPAAGAPEADAGGAPAPAPNAETATAAGVVAIGADGASPPAVAGATPPDAAAPPAGAGSIPAAPPAVASAAPMPGASPPVEGINPAPPPDAPGTPVAAAGSPTPAIPSPVMTPPATVPPAEVASITPMPGVEAAGTAPNAGAAGSPMPPSLAENRILYNAAEGVLLHHTADDAWVMLPRRSLVHAGDEVASPEPFESSLQLLESEGEIVLSGARVTVAPALPDMQAAITVNRGRLIFRRSPLPTLNAPIKVQLAVGRETYILELLEPGATVGLEVIWEPSAAAAGMPQTPAFDGGFFLTAGSAHLTSKSGGDWNLGGSGAYLPIVASRPADAPQPLVTSPAWLTPLSTGAAAVARQTARQFEESFQIDLPIAETIPALVENRHPRISELATLVLALTDNYPSLVRSLSAPHEESRQAAILALGRWLRSAPENGELLAAEVQRSFSSDSAAAVMEMLYGYPPEAGRDAEISSRLVDWLADGDVAVRELAFTQIRRLTGGAITYLYHPDRTESQRAVSVRQWRNHLHKEGALLAPGDASPSPLP